VNKIYFTWQEFDVAVKELANKLPKDFHRILGIPRGGLTIAVALSHITKKPLTYKLEDPELLVVDDISDSGRTLNQYGPFAKYTATIHMVRDTIYVPTVYVHEKPKDAWIVYPWEVDNE